VFVYAYDDPASNTFHGRDVFAPAAAAVNDVGVDRLTALERLSPADDYVDCRFPEATVEPGDGSGKRARGEVLVVDEFGNVITNADGSFLDGIDRVRVNGEPTQVTESFASVPAGEPLVTVGSHGYVECDVNRGRGDEAFDLAPGDEVVLERLV
jgi:S-adenosylmethionine hydrolase